MSQRDLCSAQRPQSQHASSIAEFPLGFCSAAEQASDLLTVLLKVIFLTPSCPMIFLKLHLKHSQIVFLEHNTNIIIIILLLLRHDKVCTHLHYSICKELGIETTENWYSHIPKPVTEHEDVTVLWNQGIQTDREVLSHRPDIIIKNKDKTCLLFDVAIPSDKNVIQKEAEKKLKYKNLSIEIQRLRNMKCFVIPVIIGAKEL
jgi:hypothetical protein